MTNRDLGAPRRPQFLPLTFGLLPGAALACSLAVTTSDLTGGARALDGGDVALALDAGDARAQGDASLEAGASGPFCLGRTPIPTFCMDFDLSKKPDDQWTFSSKSGFSTGGLFELDGLAFVSAPVSLHVAVPSAVPDVTTRLGWEPGAAEPITQTAHFECQLRVDSVDSFQSPILFSVSFDSGYGLDFRAARTKSSFLESVPTDGGTDLQTTTPVARLLTLGKWTFAELDVVFSPPSFTARLDGEIVVDHHALAVGAKAGVGRMSIGVRYYPEGSPTAVDATSVHFDNVLFDLK